MTTQDATANASTAVGSASVLTHHNDNARTGANLNEAILNTSNVNSQQFGKLFEYPVDGHVYAQPLYVSGVTMANGNTHNVLYVATMHNTVYAFDADNPNTRKTPLWSKSLGPSISLPDPDIGPNASYHDIAMEVGILSTPVISLEHNALYVVAATKTGPQPQQYTHRLHALDLVTGAEKFNGPVTIQAGFKGKGYQGDTIVNGAVQFRSNRQVQRTALLLANDTVYLAFAAYEDTDPYHGWILGYGAATLKQTAVFNTTPNGEEGGIWQAGQGPAADSDGLVYVLTGNGTFSQDGSELSDCFIKFRPNLTVLDWFAPYNNAALSAKDSDVGSSGPMLIPDTDFVIGGGKEGKLFLLDKNKMGHFVANANNNQIAQWFYIIVPDDFSHPYTMGPGHTHHVHAGPVYWNGPNGPWIYVWAENDELKAFHFDNGRFQTTDVPARPAPPPTNPPSKDPGIAFPGGFLGVPASQSGPLPLSESLGMPGGALSISANGGQDGTGIVWASHPHKQALGSDANQHIVSGILRAFDASNLSNELWNSEMNASDSIGNFAKFCPPTVANGKVYLASFGSSAIPWNITQQQRTQAMGTCHVTVYGLLSGNGS
ncbi:MAG TPA: hypothetical protein VFQ30_10830 [Ktedonobacteraceae bacterium]|nr:hypothetical protein [Ktedonobacteraceae bacterium]